MDNRLELERRGREPHKVKRMTLDNCRSQTTNGISENLAQYSNLESLSMINAGLTTLKGFPRLPNLKKLDISDNRLAGGLNHVTEVCPKLETLFLGGNRFRDLDSLEPLKQLKDLKHLDMMNCDIVALEDYRQKIFDFLPQLVDLDSLDRENNEVLDDDGLDGSENEEEDDEDDVADGDSDEDVENHNGQENDENHYAYANGVDQEESNEGSEMDNNDDEDEEEEEDDSDEGEEHIPPPLQMHYPTITLDEEDDEEENEDEDNDEGEEHEGAMEDEEEEDDDDEDDEDEENETLEQVVQSSEVGSRGLKRAHSEEEEDELQDDDEDGIQEIEG